MSQEAISQLKEHTDLLDILRNKYAEVDDAQTVSAVEELLEETTQATQEEAMKAEDIIQRLVSTNTQASQEARYPEDEVAHADRMANLEATKDKIESDRDALQERAQELAAQREEVQDIIRVKEPQARSSLGLYMHIAQLNWSLKEPHMVSGTVSDPERQDIRHFAFDSRQHSQFEAVQKVWNAIY